MTNSGQAILKGVVSGIALLLAFLIVQDPEGTRRWLDSTFLLLIAVPIVVFLVPWKRLTSFKAAGIELVLDSPSVRGAIRGIKMSTGESRSIRRTLYELKEAIEDSRGSRVLWIDDHPEEILGERRILRALDIQVRSAKTSASAQEILDEDDDFDLIISDMQRKSDPESAFSRYGGVEFIKALRQSSDDPVVQRLPVIFYTAYRPDQVETILDQVSARAIDDIHFCHSIEGLLREVFRILPVARSEVIVVSSRKRATDI